MEEICFITLLTNSTTGRSSTRSIFVTHASPYCLFNVDPHFEGVEFQPGDIFIVGFKNAISRILEKNPDWQKETFSVSGIAIDLYENKQTKNRIICQSASMGINS